MDKLIVGCGYLGRRVARPWLEQGHRVFGTTRRLAGAEELRALGMEPVMCDVLDAPSLGALPSVDTVVYCVGLDRSAGKSMRDVYVGGLANVLASGLRTSKFIYVSSTGVYGQTGGEEVDETAATEPIDDSGRVVLDAEKLLSDAIVLRFAGIYGPERLIRRQSIEKGEPLVGDANKWLNLIHVEDGASAVLAAEERGKVGRMYNVSDDQPVRRRDFYTTMAKLLKAPEPRFVAPEPGTPLPSHERANRRIVNRRLCEELGVRLTFPTYEEGLRAVIESASIM